jgi:hypothetical protein
VIAHAEYNYRPFRKVWIQIGLSDPTAFQLSLASAQLFRNSMSGSPDLDITDNEKSAKHYYKAVKQLSDRLGDELECLRPGVVATVLGCICHDVSLPFLASTELLY